MTLTELADTLPNGFHDAELERLDLDYATRTARITLNLWIGDLHSVSESDRERYRCGQLTLSGFQYFIIETPDYDDHADGAPAIDIGELHELTNPPLIKIPARQSADLFENWIYVNWWNSFMYVAAREARWEWQEELPA